MSELLASMEKLLSKQIKGIKQSIQYVITKKNNELKNTFIMHKVPTVCDAMKTNKKTLNIKLPIAEDATFIEFDENLKTDGVKEAALVRNENVSPICIGL